MIKILLPGEAYYYDVQALTKAFFPMEEISFFSSWEGVERESEEKRITFSFGSDRIGISLDKDGIPIFEEFSPFLTEEEEEARKKQYKNEVKRLLYRCLSQSFQRRLDWGTLTGVRPTKIPMAYYMEGMEEEEVQKRMEEEYYMSRGKAKLCCEVAKRELSLLEGLDYKNGYSIYIGIPFCPTTCLYCSFTSYSYKKLGSMADAYLEALFKEMDYTKDCLPGKILESIYIGGGTPTALCEEQLERLLEKVQKTFDFTHVKEYTVEAGRPDSITEEKLRLMKQYGVGRISINPQTMQQKTLDTIGRSHTAESVKEAFQMARRLGHDNINMDLIVGLPGETIEDVEDTLRQVGELDPDSITIHSLVTKRAARLNLNRELRDCADMDKMAESGMAFCRKHGYLPYYMYRQKNTTGSSQSANQENIGYAKEGKEGLYNILIMEEKQIILALGAGGSSKFVFPGGQRVERVENVKSLTDYIFRIDEMIDRKRSFIKKECNFNTKGIELLDKAEFKDVLQKDLIDIIRHGILVSRVAAFVGKEMGSPEGLIKDLVTASLLHDIGKLRLSKYLYGRIKGALDIEQIKYMRRHAKYSYEIVKEAGYSEDIQKMVYYHHENYDGSGYPGNLSGEDIPWGARILRLCDVFCALVSNRPYRVAFDVETAIEMMIDEVENFDMQAFLMFQRVVNSEEFSEIQEIIDKINNSEASGQMLTVLMKEFEEEAL